LIQCSTALARCPGLFCFVFYNVVDAIKKIIFWKEVIQAAIRDCLVWCGGWRGESSVTDFLQKIGYVGFQKNSIAERKESL